MDEMTFEEFFEEDEDDVFAKLGICDQFSWKYDSPSPSYSDVYNDFLKNGGIGILDEEGAKEAWRKMGPAIDGKDDEYPEIDAITAKRNEVMSTLPERPDLATDQANYLYPYEPLFRFKY